MSNLTVQPALHGPYSLEIIDHQGKHLAGPVAMSSRQSLVFNNMPEGDLTVLATRPSGEQFATPVSLGNQAVTLELAVPRPVSDGTELSQFGLGTALTLNDGVSLGSLTSPTALPASPLQIPSFLSSSLSSIANRNLLALTRVNRQAIAFPNIDTEPQLLLQEAADEFRLARWTWQGSWRRVLMPGSAVRIDSGRLVVSVPPTHACASAVGLLSNSGVNRRSKVPPYRRAKGTPLRDGPFVDSGRKFRSAGGVGRA